MKTPFLLCLFIGALTAGAGELTIPQLHVTTIDGSPVPDLQRRFFEYLNLPSPARTSNEVARSLSTLFPRGTPRDKVLKFMRDVRRRHVWDTSLSTNKFGEILENNRPQPGSVEFEVFTYCRSHLLEDGTGKKLSDDVFRRSFVVALFFDKDDRLTDCRSWDSASDL